MISKSVSRASQHILSPWLRAWVPRTYTLLTLGFCAHEKDYRYSTGEEDTPLGFALKERGVLRLMKRVSA